MMRKIVHVENSSVCHTRRYNNAEQSSGQERLRTCTDFSKLDTQIKQVEIDRWLDTGFVKKLQRRDNTFYYYNRKRECEDQEVHKVKVYAY